MRNLKKISYAVVLIAVVLLLFTAALNRLVPSAGEVDQANNLVRAISPLASAENQKVYGAAGFMAFRIEVFGVSDPKDQDRILQRLEGEIAKMSLKQHVKVQFYRRIESRTVGQKDGWTEKQTIKIDLLREVVLP